jgi:hypothetical protein
MIKHWHGGAVSVMLLVALSRPWKARNESGNMGDGL